MLSKLFKQGGRWPAMDWWLAVLSIGLLCIYIVAVYINLPEDANFLTTLPTIIVFTLLIDGIKSLTEAILANRKFLHVPHSRVNIHSNLSVLIACHDGESKIANTIQNVKKSLPGAEVYVVDDCSHDSTGLCALKAGAKVLKLGKNRGKVGALHRLLEHVKTEYVLIMDDDMSISGVNMPYALLDRFDAVAFNVLPEGNTFISKLQRYEYRKSMEIGKNFHASTGSVLCVSGAVGFFRTDRLLRQIDQHSGEFSGEDLERTLLVHSYDDSKGVTFINYIVTTEVPQSFIALFRQRCLGWNPGFMGNIKLFMGILFSRNKPIQLRIDTAYNLMNIPLDVLRVLSLPVLVKYPIFMVIMYLLYVLIDTCLYVATNRKDSFGMVLLAPFYGIFCLITRFIGMFVYFYREFTELLYWRLRNIPDSYKRAPLALRLVSTAITASLLVAVLIFGVDFIA